MLSAREFVDTITSNLLGRRVFIFTPKGQVTNLRTRHRGRLCLLRHVGMFMKYAKVNGVQVGFDHLLKNADVVEIFMEKEDLPAHDDEATSKHRLSAVTRRAAKDSKQLAVLVAETKELRESLQIEALTLCGKSFRKSRTASAHFDVLRSYARARRDGSHGCRHGERHHITKSGANIDSYTASRLKLISSK